MAAPGTLETASTLCWRCTTQIDTRITTGGQAVITDDDGRSIVVATSNYVSSEATPRIGKNVD